MKKLFTLKALQHAVGAITALVLLVILCGLTTTASAQNIVSPTATTAATQTTVATTVQTLIPNKGDTAWVLTATLLIIMMSIPGLALFYGGMVRSKNMLSILMQVFSVFTLIVVLWAIYGYSLAFTQGNPFIGGFDRLFLRGIFDPVTGSVANVATFSKGVVIPEFAFVVFQATFAAITVALIVGAVAERMKFTAVLLFATLWFTFAYLPIAHMVWFWMGPDAYTNKAAAATATAAAGWLFQKGALDFAGGMVVHISAAVAGLVGAFVVGKRMGYGKEPMPPHNLVMTMLGGCLLWVGWFGFNAGSALEAGGAATLAFVNTLEATAAAALTWSLVERLFKGRVSMLGAISGAVSGLVAITPACGWVGVGGGLAIGALAGVTCFWGVTGLKKLLGADDSLDVFGIHGIGGILGALLTGVFNTWKAGGTGIPDYVNNTIVDTVISEQLWAQAQAVLTVVIWSGVVSFVCYKIVDLTIGLRVNKEEEREGLDLATHGERAYNL